MKLLVVESPAKSKTISKYLGKEYVVKASVGHVRDLPKSNKNAIDIDGGFVPHYENVKGKEKVIADISDAAKKADEVILATDADREGEAISWHLAEILREQKIKTPITRAVYHEITKEAVTKALEHPRKIDQNLRRAQEARRVLDRLVGYDLSGLIWKKVRYGLSAGRVQSPALRILVEREREIKAFIAETFWVITAAAETPRKEQILLTCTEEPRDKKLVDEIVKKGTDSEWAVKDVSETEAKRSPKAPFITSTLQQAASSRLGFSPARTMSIAQKLYEAGLITYMRTDSTNLSDTAKQSAHAIIEKQFGKGLSESRTYTKKVKNAQEAHEAIRPTNLSVESAGTTDDQHKLYKLIWQRTLASQMVDAKVLRTKITANIVGESIPDFAANGSRTVFAGWLLADPEARGEDVELPKVSTGEKLIVHSVDVQEKQTEPPPRYTEAGLVKELEKRGIGRPSTYASIIETLVRRAYVTKEGRSLQPTDTGEVVSGFLEKNFGNYISDTFTADIEDQLDDIALGKRDYEKTLSQFYKPFIKEVKAKSKTAEKITNLGDADPKWKCPICGGPMIIKLSKAGKFMSCAKFPECTGARTIEGEELAGPKETGELCPDCGGKLIERDGRFGRFVACSNYPKCKYVKKSAEEEAKGKTGVMCPTCKTGEIVERRGRFGPFFSCSNYPKCTFAIKARPTGRTCDLCNSLMMEGTKTIPERCSNKLCEQHQPGRKRVEK
ncbi:MAG: DNA topoisomerase I [Candidatus Taylorbacteria bacterium RIFCSPHIGHO2_01_FULL_46_22b]|uniref:DNA topoisomerase 1 n=1 Tax=Candidatus Taylorbacteria bacterium RIFCSPHIGHO2_01_FULL_46_22b TaxID=1802301 RepID=A0A1G2M1J3_9BACT|nr:MAG: DNA topoisomerase I [Candidatus Taylorbacteria bacterium RIFCSPHIGHO2_01_FULL_46_22b]